MAGFPADCQGETLTLDYNIAVPPALYLGPIEVPISVQ